MQFRLEYFLSVSMIDFYDERESTLFGRNAHYYECQNAVCFVSPASIVSVLDW